MIKCKHENIEHHHNNKMPVESESDEGLSIFTLNLFNKENDDEEFFQLKEHPQFCIYNVQEEI